jgi:hypothetical protein
MPGKLLLKLQIERDHVDQRTCHECPEWRLTQDAEPKKKVLFFADSWYQRDANPRVRDTPTLDSTQSAVVYGQSPAKSKMGLAAWAKP